MYDCPDHPDIVAIERNGYPDWYNTEEITCDCCGDEITGDVYEDSFHDCLCESCLIKLHRKEVW